MISAHSTHTFIQSFSFSRLFGVRHTEKTLNEKLSADDRVKTRRGPEDATFDDDIPATVDIFSSGFYFKVFFIFHEIENVMR